MNRKRTRSLKKQRRYCHAVHSTRSTNGLIDPKVIYNTEEDAWTAIRATTRNALVTVENHTPYLCRATGDHYHVGRRDKQPATHRQDFLEFLKTIPGGAKVLRNS